MTGRGGNGLAAGSRLHSRVLRVGLELDLLDLAGERGFVWLSPAGEVATAGVAAEVRVPTGRDRVQRAADATGALLGQARVDDPEGTGLGPLAAGAVPFGEATPGRLSVPALVVRRGPDRALWAVATAAGRRPDPPDLRTRPRAGAGGDGAWPEVRAVRAPAGQDRAGFQAAVRAALDVIAGPRLGGGRLGGGLLGGGGLLDKVVLARELLVEAAGPFPRQAVLRRLRERAAGSFVYASGGFVGASPELLVARRGRTATSRPMAGTVPRGGAAGEEAGREAWLRASGKETAEHRLVVDMVAETLAKVADDIAVAPVEVVRLPTVAHLATRVSAELTAPVPSALELAGLLHPTPAVAGSPRDAALEVLAGLEPFDRGRYGGPVGWVDHRGDGEWAVALRCATLHRAGARLVAGAGIVAGSDPDAEWAETGYKLEAMLRVLTSS